MARRHTTTHTIQTWPSGQSFEYRGDPDGPANQRSLRAGYYQARIRCANGCNRVADGTYVTLPPPNTANNLSPVCAVCRGAGYLDNPTKNPWREGTNEEWRQIRIALRAEMYWNRDGHGCDSALVDDLIQAANAGDLSGDLAEGFGYDEIRNLHKDPSDWDAATCRAYIADHGLDYMSDCTCPVQSGGRVEDTCIQHGDDLAERDLDELRDVCREYAQDDPAEVYEWWRVSSWLCTELDSIGEVTIDNGYGHWWGRTCTGQSLLMDGTLQQIAAKYETE